MTADDEIGVGRGDVLARLDLEELNSTADAVRFEYDDAFGNRVEGVALCVGEDVIAFRNDCPHLGFPLDGSSGEFLDDEREQLVCDSHGARFDVESGRCTAGPCKGDRLEWFRVDVDESAGEVVVRQGRGLSI